MKRNFTYLKSLLLVMLICAGSGSVWGQYTGSGTFAKINSMDNLTDGYYVIAYAEAQAMNTTNAGKFFANSAITVSSGSIVNPATNIVWEIKNTENGYTITNGSIYVSYKGSSNESYSVTTYSDECLWAISYSSNVFKFNSKKVPARYLKYNTGAPRFACYTSGQQDITLYKMKVQAAVATPTFNPASGAKFNETLTVDLACETQGADIRYTTDNTDPTETSALYSNSITIDKTTTIKAKAFKDGESSDISSALYIKDLLKNNAQFVIAVKLNDKYYAMSQMVSNNKMVMEEISINAEMQAQISSNNVIWNLGVVNNKYTLKGQNGEFLNGTSGGTDLTTSQTELQWEITAQADGTYRIGGQGNRFIAYRTGTFNYWGNYTLSTADCNYDLYLLPIAKTNTSEDNTDILLTGEWTSEELGNMVIPATATSVDMTNIIIPDGTTLPAPANPNCLLYINSTANVTGNNIVKVDASGNATSDNITLTDGLPFKASMKITAAQASMTRTGLTADKLSTIYIPFSAPLADGSKAYTFTAVEDRTVVFSPVEDNILKANTPYVIAPAGATLNIAITTPVDIIPEAAPEATTGYAFLGTYTRINAVGKYGFKNGAFALGIEGAAVPAFRAYLEPANPQGAPSTLGIDIDGNGTTDITENVITEGMHIFCTDGIISILTDKTQSVNIYGIDGSLIRTEMLSKGTNTIEGMAKGMYIVNNHKVIVK